MKKFFKNWKTTVGGILLAVGQGFPPGSKWNTILTGAGGLLVGIGAKDADVSGTGEDEKKK